MRSLVGAWLPWFNRQESENLKGSFDFLGFNYYSTRFAVNNPNPDFLLDARVNMSCKLNFPIQYNPILMRNYKSCLIILVATFRIKIFLAVWVFVLQ